MFGGLAFLVGGNMAVAASGQGGLLVRVDPAESDRLVAGTSARPMEMRGRELRGWLRVDSEEGPGRAGPGEVGRPRHRLCPLPAAEALTGFPHLGRRDRVTRLPSSRTSRASSAG